MAKKPRAKKRAKHAPKDKGVNTPGCVLPHEPSDEALRSVMVGRSEHKEREIVEYVEWQLGKTSPVHVRHLEKLMAEKVGGQEHELWDVHTTNGRWWVVTEPKNVYPQKAFPSADYMLSFHIGLAARVAERARRSADDPFALRFVGAFRRWEQAANALEAAKEAEDLQAVGMKCRECLLTLVRDAQADVEIPEGTTPPKVADFNAWSELLVNWALPGAAVEEIRHHVKHVSTSTWKLVSWLTHARSARHSDARLAVSAVRHLLDSFAAAIVRRESEQPERCPKCSSYQLASVYTPELGLEPPYIVLCEACGWENPESEGEESPPGDVPGSP